MADVIEEALAVDVDTQYAACLDSVSAIAAAKAEGNTAAVRRNVDHLELMVAKDFWGPEHDLTVFTDAIASAYL